MSNGSKTNGSKINSIANTHRDWVVTAFWIVTAIFCVEMLFTAWYEWRVLPAAAEAFARLGFSSSAFRVELSCAKIAGVLALLIPRVPARLKEWAYAGFAINLISALIAHASIADRRLAFVPSSLSLIFWLMSYLCFRRLESRANAPSKLPESLSVLAVQSA